jgi:hypothetical protein
MPEAGYQGEIAAIVCGNGGLNANLNPSKISLKNVIQAEGAVFRQDHWRKEPGTALFGTILASPVGGDPDDALIVALNDWHPTETVQRIVSLRGDGYLYFTDNGGTNPGAHVSTTTSGAGTRFGYFVTGGAETGAKNRKLWLFRNNKQPTFLDGDVTNDTVITKPAVDWSDAHPPIVGIINGGGFNAGATGGGGRLVAAGNSNSPHTLYASVFGDQTDFTTNTGTATDFQTLSVFPGVGERIYGLRSYQGFNVVFKFPRGIFIADMRDTDPANWLVQQVTDAIGIAPTPYAALQLENDILFLGSDGQFYLFSAVLAAATGQQNMETANLGMRLQIYEFLLNAYNRNLLNQVQSVYQPFWQTATFIVPQPGSTKNTSRLVFDFNAVPSGGDPRFSYSYRDTAASIAIRRDPSDFIDKPMYGDYQSNIILLEQDARTTWNGATYPFTVQTPFSNLGEFENLAYDKFVQFANRRKLFDFLEIEYLAFTDATVTIDVYTDGVFRQTILAHLTTGGDPLAATASTPPPVFIIGFSALSGGAFPRDIVKRLNAGDGKRVSFVFQNNNYGEDVAITHFFIGFRPGDTTQAPRNG